jgi:hypothetical protein
MKTYCRLRVPYTPEVESEYIDVPSNVGGVKLAEWWKSASDTSRVAVVRGAVDNDYVTSWRKVAEEEEAAVEHSLKSVIKRLEAEPEAAAAGESVEPAAKP